MKKLLLGSFLVAAGAALGIYLYKSSEEFSDFEDEDDEDLEFYDKDIESEE